MEVSTSICTRSRRDPSPGGPGRQPAGRAAAILARAGRHGSACGAGCGTAGVRAAGARHRCAPDRGTPLVCKTNKIHGWVLAELSDTGHGWPNASRVAWIRLPTPAVRGERVRARWRLHLVRQPDCWPSTGSPTTARAMPTTRGSDQDRRRRARRAVASVPGAQGPLLGSPSTPRCGAWLPAARGDGSPRWWAQGIARSRRATRRQHVGGCRLSR